MKKKTDDDFRKSFASAKKSGSSKFDYKGKTYSTQTAEEKASKQTIRQNLTDASRSAAEAGKRQNKSKSHNEIANSYGSAYSKQYNSMPLAERKKHDEGLLKNSSNSVALKKSTPAKKSVPKNNVYKPGKGFNIK